MNITTEQGIHYLGTYEIDRSFKHLIEIMTDERRTQLHTQLTDKKRFTAKMLEEIARMSGNPIQTRLKWTFLTCHIDDNDNPVFHAGTKRVSKAKAEERLETTVHKNIRMEALLYAHPMVAEHTVTKDKVDVTLHTGEQLTTPTVWAMMKLIHSK